MSRRTLTSLFVASLFVLWLGHTFWSVENPEAGSATSASTSSPEADVSSVRKLPTLPSFKPLQDKVADEGAVDRRRSPQAAIGSPEAQALPLEQLRARLESDQSDDELSLVLEALRRWHQCRNYVRHPEARSQQLESLLAHDEDAEAQIVEWEIQDRECPEIDSGFAESALQKLIEAADAGSFEAQVAYYRWGLAGRSGAVVRDPELAIAYVNRMRRYLDPLLSDQPPHAFDLLFDVFRDGWVFPRDYMRSATYRFASYYYQGLPPAEIDRRRIAWGRNLTDAEIDAAEQAGYALYVECCGS